MTQLTPADALGMIRAEIVHLQRREAQLRVRMIATPQHHEGRLYRVEISEDRRKVFRHDLLPPEVLRNPTYWDERLSVDVSVYEKSAVSPAA